MRQEEPVSTSPSKFDFKRQLSILKSERRIVQQNRRVAGTKVALVRMAQGSAPQQIRESADRSLSYMAKRGDWMSFSSYRIQNMFLQLGSLLRPNIPAGYMPQRSSSQSTKSIQAFRACNPQTHTDYHPKNPQQQPRPQVISNRQAVTLKVELRLGSNLEDL